MCSKWHPNDPANKGFPHLAGVLPVESRCRIDDVYYCWNHGTVRNAEHTAPWLFFSLSEISFTTHSFRWVLYYFLSWACGGKSWAKEKKANSFFFAFLGRGLYLMNRSPCDLCRAQSLATRTPSPPPPPPPLRRRFVDAYVFPMTDAVFTYCTAQVRVRKRTRAMYP